MERIWAVSQDTFFSKVAGPVFERMCRLWAEDMADPQTFSLLAASAQSGEVREQGQVEGDREGFCYLEDVSLLQGDRFTVAAVFQAQDLDLRVRVEVDDPVLRDAGIGVLGDLAYPVLALAARATGDHLDGEQHVGTVKLHATSLFLP